MGQAEEAPILPARKIARGTPTKCVEKCPGKSSQDLEADDTERKM